MFRRRIGVVVLQMARASVQRPANQTRSLSVGLGVRASLNSTAMTDDFAAMTEPQMTQVLNRRSTMSSRRIRSRPTQKTRSKTTSHNCGTVTTHMNWPMTTPFDSRNAAGNSTILRSGTTSSVGASPKPDRATPSGFRCGLIPLRNRSGTICSTAMWITANSVCRNTAPPGCCTSLLSTTCQNRTHRIIQRISASTSVSPNS
jgi:hypothetical protein